MSGADLGKIVDLYAKTLHAEDAELFLRKTGKELWAELRAALKGTTRRQRQEIWEDRLEALVEAKYKREPTAFVVKKYRGKSTYTEMWRKRRVKAKWRFVNCFKKAPKPLKVVAEQTIDHTTVIITVKRPKGGWDHDGILAGLENLFTRIPGEVLEPIIGQAKTMAERRRQAVA